MTVPILLFDQTLRNTVLADPAIHAAVSGQVYQDAAPVKAVPPYIIIAYNSPPRSIHDTQTGQMEAVYSVKAVVDVDVDGAARALEIAQLLYDRLHDTKPDMTAGGWDVYRCQHETVFRFLEQVDRKNYQHAGGLYTLGATQIVTVE